MGRRILLAGLVGAAVLLAPPSVPVLAQQTDDTESAGFLERQIQNLLGGEGRDVRVIGLEGVLSSEASIARIEVADDDGTWLIVREVVLDWNRLALLRRRLDVEALTVGAVELLRTPLPGPAAPPALAAEAEPTPFALPDLPVSVQVQQLSVGELSLREPVIGRPLAVSIDGSARLADGEGSVDIAIVRIDGQEGRFSLEAGFDNDTRNLLVDLDVTEAEGGLIASLAGMPGEPSLELTATGDAPISDFTATLDLITDGVDRLDGTVNLREEPGPDGVSAATRVITAAITGDVADLFVPEYRDFFGRALSLDLLARQNPETGVSVERLNLVTQGLTLAGTVELTPAMLPERIALDARVANPLGLPVILPVPGARVLVEGADLTLNYDEATGDSLVLDLDARGIQRSDGLLIDRATLSFDGSLEKSGDTALAAVGGDLTAAMEGFSSTDPALWDAVQDSLEASARIDWTNDGPLEISGLRLSSGEDLSLAGGARVTGLQTGTIAVSGDIAAEAGDLSRFSAIAGRDLSGALAADLTAGYDLSTGAFELELDGRGDDLAFGQGDADRLLEGNSRLQVNASRSTEGISVDTLSLEAPRISLNGSAAIAPDGFPRLVDLTGRVGNPDGGPVRLPVPGAATDLQSADLRLFYDADSGEAFTADIAARGLTRADGIAIGSARVQSSGNLVRGAGLVPQSVDGTLSASVSDASATDAGLDAILSEGFDLEADLTAALDEGTAALRNLTARSGDLSVSGRASASGLTTEDAQMTATVTLDSGPLARFAALTGQDLSGRVEAETELSYQLGSGFFGVDLTGAATDLGIGREDIDPLLAGRADLSLSASRDAGGLSVRDLRLTSPIADVQGDVVLAPDFWPRRAVVSARLDRRDGTALPVPGQPLTLGSANLNVQYDAEDGDSFTARVVASDLQGPEGLRVGRSRLDADGQLRRGAGTAIDQIIAAITAEVEDAGADEPGLNAVLAPGLALTADVDARPAAGSASLRDLSLTSADLSVSGRADLSGLGGDDARAQATVRLDSGPLARFAALTGQDLSGRVEAETEIGYQLGNGFFDIDLSGAATDLGLGREDIDPLLAGRADLSLSAARDADGIAVDTLRLTTPIADVQGDIELAPDYWPRRAVLSANLASRDGSPLPVPTRQLTLRSADLDVDYDAARGDAFTVRLVASDLAGQDGLRVGRSLIAADGRLRRGDGTAIEQVAAAIRAEVSDATANDPALRAAVQPGLQFSTDLDVLPGAGTASLRDLALTAGELRLSGRADVTGIDQGTPAAVAEIALDTGALDRFAPLVGRPLRGRLTADAEAAYDTATGFFEVDATADGTNLGIGIAEVDRLIGGQSRIRLDALRNETGLELPQLDVMTPELTVRASGGMQSGGGTIDLTAELRDLGVVVPDLPGALRVTGQAVNRGEVWGVDLALQGPAGTRAQVNGDVLRPDGSVDLAATGALPLGLANRIIAPRSVEGDLTFDLAVSGPAALDSVSGQIRVGGARVSDPASRLALEDLTATVALANARAQLDAGGNLNSGGRITVTGPIGLTGNLPADLAVALNDLKLVDPRLYEIDLGGTIDVEGPLAGGAAITGRIDIDRAEIRIPSALGGAASIPDIVHVGETGQSRLTRARAGLLGNGSGGGGEGGAGGGGVAYPLDIVISAPNQIFIRGRGLDAELGGRIRIGGTTANVEPTGELSLIRGRMALLARRLEFTEATVSLQGDLVPDIRMVATSSNDSITASIVVEGPITAPEIRFESQPELPEDEVLAQLFFDKPLTDLTPFEVAQLAAALRTLTGGGGGGLFNSIREGLGVDDLNVTSDQEGNTQVTAGKYISDRVYTDVVVGSDGTTEIQLNYELGRDFDVRGSYDNSGNTGIGITFERDY